jgi:subtilisin family serine protease
MRDWYQKIIKLDEALPLVSANNRVVVGVMEGLIEWEAVTPDLHGLNYKAKSPGLFKVISRNVLPPGSGTISVQKSSYAGIAPGIGASSNVNLADEASAHATSTSGIIVGNERDSANMILPIKGVVESAELINMRLRFIELIIASVDNFKYYSGNGPIINSMFLGGSSIFAMPLNNDYLPPHKKVQVVNASVSIEIGATSFYVQADIQIAFNTLKTYGNNGRGVVFVASAGNSGNNLSVSKRETEEAQNIGRYSKYPLIVSAVTINNEKIFNKIEEVRSTYSSYGLRVDLAGPSNGTSSQPENKNGIYTTTRKNCGELGTVDEIITIPIATQSSALNLELTNTHKIFPGNCVEMGLGTSVEHEVLIVKSVNRSTNIITFESPREYTAPPTMISPASVNIPILKTMASMVGTTNYKIQVTDKSGFGHIGQEICIFSATSHHYGTISQVNSNTEYEFNPVLPAAMAGLVIGAIPGRSVATPTSYAIVGEDTEFYFPGNYSNNILTSFFDGEMIQIEGAGTNPPTVANIKEICLTGRKKIVIEKYNLQTPGLTITLKSVGYGSYTSTFGGTSAAGPVVAGVAALLAKTNPNLNVLEIKQILKTTADKIRLDEGDLTGIWKDAAGNNISFSSETTLTQNTILGSNEIFVSNMANLNVNDAVEIDGDFRSVIDKKLTDRLVLQLGLTKVYNSGKSVKKGTVPVHSQYYGTGRVNAKRAVILANAWHTPTPPVPVNKPTLVVADRVNATSGAIEIVPVGEAVDSPDIWIKEFTDVTPDLPSVANPFNTANISKDQKIYIKTRNLGNITSYEESDIRIFLSFTNDVNPPFKFPDKWFHEPDNATSDNTILLAVKPLTAVAANSNNIMVIDWQAFYEKWKEWNPLNKRTYINVHLAPFDGTSAEIQTDNIRSNKQLSSKEIIVSAFRLKVPGSGYVTAYELTIPPGSGTSKSFELEMLNLKTTMLSTIKLELTMIGATNEVVSFVKEANPSTNWIIEGGGASPAWLTFHQPVITANLVHTDYSNIIFPHELNIIPGIVSVNFKIINA